MIKFPIKMIYSKEVVEHAVNQLDCTVMQVCRGTALFVYISDTGYIYINRNAVEFGISGYTFIERRAFLQEQMPPTLKDLYIWLIPNDRIGTQLMFKVQKSNYNYVYDSEDKSYYKGNYTIKVLNKEQIKILSDWSVLL